ncbi:MAG: uroporphyrinogen decarboxylase family protein [Anaerolineae bacterium]
MNRKERVFEAFRLGQPERIPATVFGGGMWTLLSSGTDFQSLIGHPQEMARVNIETNRRMGFPIVYVGSGYNNFHAAALGGRIKFRAVGAPDLEEPLVEHVDELDDLNIDDLAKDELVQTVWEATRIVAAELGDEVVVTATAWGPFTLGAQIYGVEKVMRSIYKWPQDVKKVMEFAARVIMRFYQPLLEEKVIPMTSIADPTASGDLVSRQHFAEFALPYLQMLNADTRSKGAFTLLHICGDTTDKLDLLVETGADCVSIDHKVDIGRARDIFHGRMCLAGNVDPVHVLLQGTPDAVEAACRDCLGKAAAGGGFILMPGCDIPPTVPEENLRVFLRTAESWPVEPA